MEAAPFPPNESERLQALADLQLKEQPDVIFDRVTKLAAEIFQVPMAFISFIERERQWFKARIGLEVSETPRDLSFCAHAILGEGAMVIPDARKDQRFADNPLVTGGPSLRFYAGHPLRAPGGEKVGTLCIADNQPHEISEEQMRVLPHLASLIEQELRMGDVIDAQSKLLSTQAKLLQTQQRLQAELAEAANYVRSLIPPPMTEPVEIDWRYLPSAEVGGDCVGYQFLGDSKLAVYVLDVSGHGIGAALLAVVLLDLLRSHALVGVDFSSPASVLNALNREFPMQRHGRFFTVWYGVIDLSRRQLTFNSAGHPPAVLIRQNGERELLTGSGIPAGCVDLFHYEEHRQQLEPGDTLFIYSDGAFELRGTGRKSLPTAELIDFFAQATGDVRGLDGVLDRLHRVNAEHPFEDDVSLLKIRLPSGS